MGFFDENPDAFQGGGGGYIGADEKKELKASGAVLTITSIITEENPFNGNERFALSVEVGGDDRLLTFDIGTGADKRDKDLAKLKSYLDAGGDAVKVTLGKAGRAWVLNAA